MKCHQSVGAERRAPLRLGRRVTETMSRDAVISANPAVDPSVAIADYSHETGHNIPNVFIDPLGRQYLLQLAGPSPVWRRLASAAG